MTPCASGGRVMCGEGGHRYIRTEKKLPLLSPEGLGRLLFFRDRVSLFAKGPEEVHKDTAHVSGPVSLSPSGRAVIISAGNQRYLLFRDRFPAVAPGDEISGRIVEIPSHSPDSGLPPASQGGIAP